MKRTRPQHTVPRDKLRNVLGYSFYGSPEPTKSYTRPHMPKHEKFVYEMKSTDKALIFERGHKGEHSNERYVAGARINHETGRVQIFKPKTVESGDYNKALPELRGDLKKGYSLYSKHHSDQGQQRKYQRKRA